MIPKEGIFKCVLFATFLFTANSQNSRSYDTNDWIPITKKCPSCSPKDDGIEQKATGRVLNLREHPIRNQFFPEEFLVRTKKSNSDQYLREVSSPPSNRPFQQNFQSTPNFRNLNEGEVLNQFFRQPGFEQQRQPHLLFQQPPQQFPTQYIFPPENTQAYKSQFNHPPLLRNPLVPQSESLNSLQQTRPSSTFGFQELNYTKPNSIESLSPVSPGLINQALSTEIVPSSNTNFRDVPTRTTPSKPGGDSVQLLYVPIDSLNKKIQPSQSQTIKQEVPFQSAQFNPSQDYRQLQFSQVQHGPPIQQHRHQLNDNFQKQRPQTQLSHEQTHKQQQLLSIQHDFAQQALDALNLQLQLQRGQLPTVVQQSLPSTSTTTTTTTTIPITEPSTRKPKPHQPPLAVYMGGEGDVSVTDVLSILKNAKTISVQDAVGPTSPQVFVGPHNLEAPEGYVKFDLPYLSALGSNRIERKVDQLPFFVAPVSYKAPPGYSKIPLPAPHVGSVVVSQKDQRKKHDEQQQSTFNFSPDTNQFLNRPQFNNDHAFSTPHSSASHSTVAPSFLKQTINEYELSQINNQFRPQSEFQLENGSNDYEDATTFRRQHVTTTPSVVTQRVHLPQNIPKDTETSRFNKFQSNRFTPTLQPKATHQFQPSLESEDPLTDEEFKPVLPTRTTQHETFSNNAFRDEHTNIQNFRENSPTTPSAVTQRVNLPQSIPKETETSRFNKFQNNRFTPTRSKATHQFQPSLESEDPLTDEEFRPVLPTRTTQQETFSNNAFRDEYTNTQNFRENSPTTPSVVTQQVNLPQSIPKDTETSRFNKFQNNRFTLTRPKATHQVQPSLESEDPLTDEEFRPVPPTRTTQRETFSNNAFRNEYTNIQNFRENSPTTSTQEEFNPSPAPAKSFPNHSGSFRPTPNESTENPVLSQNFGQTIESNRDFEYEQQVGQNHFDRYVQNQEVLQKTKQTKPAEMINGPLLDPSFLQLNEDGEYVPIKSNHHISHKLVQQPLQENVGDVHISSTTEVPRQIQSFTEPAVIQTESEYSFKPRQRERTQYKQNVALEIATESNYQEDYKLPPELPTIHPGIHSLINNLQDQSIRPLLVPALIAPTSDPNIIHQPEHQRHLLSTEPSYVTTPPIVHTTYTSTTEPTSTTTAPRQRQRGRQRVKVSSTTYAPRKTQQTRTRRPLNVRTTTERISYQEHGDEYTDYSPTRASRVRGGYTEEYNTPESVHRPINRQRLRSRGRTTQAPQTIIQPEIPNLTERAFKQPELISGFEASQGQPQSYMQFEHQNLPNHNSKHYVSTEEVPILINKPEPDQNQMNVDVIINHPITQKVEPLIISEPEGDSHYVRFSSNIDASNVATRQPHETTTSSYVRINPRGRIRSRVKSTTTPTTTPSTTTTTTNKANEEEFYGFFRPPNFNSPQQQFYTPTNVGTTRRPTYISSNTVQYDDQPVENSNNVDIYSTNHLIPSSPTFVGELITKYTPTTTQMPTSKSVTRSRIRSRVRVPSRRIKEDNHQTYTSSPPPSEVRVRNRGRSHFVAPKIRDENKSEDEDVEGGNYPKSLPKVDSKTERPSFQITIAPPIVEESANDEDQIPYSSIHRPKVVLANYNQTGIFVNDLPIDRKVIESQEQSMALSTVSIGAENIETDDGKSLVDEIISEIDKIHDENESVTSEPDTFIHNEGINLNHKGRRRGVWKLVKRPVESFETAESQYVGKISANTLLFNNGDKRNVYNVDKFPSTEPSLKRLEIETVASVNELPQTTSPVTIVSSTPEESFLDSFYKMFDAVPPYDASTGKDSNISTTEKSQDTPVTEAEQPHAIKEFPITTTLPTAQNITDSTTPPEQKQETSTERVTTTTPAQLATEGVQTEVWDIKTSTATEISHETEICYRGKCIKSSGNNNLDE